MTLARNGFCPQTPARSLEPVTDDETGRKVWRAKKSLSPETLREIRSYGLSRTGHTPSPQRVLQEKNELSPGGSDAAGDGGEKKS